jgi:hypothetical protein
MNYVLMPECKSVVLHFKIVCVFRSSTLALLQWWEVVRWTAGVFIHLSLGAYRVEAGSCVDGY